MLGSVRGDKVMNVTECHEDTAAAAAAAAAAASRSSSPRRTIRALEPSIVSPRVRFHPSAVHAVQCMQVGREGREEK